MKVGEIVEFVYISGEDYPDTKYYVRIDEFFPTVGDVFIGGGIDSNCWFVKTETGRKWYKGMSGSFPFANCKSVKLCENKNILKKFQ